MLDWFPVDPLIDFAFRHGTNYVPESIRSDLLLYARINTGVVVTGLAWNVYKWEIQKKKGARRDAKDREQDARLDILEGKKPMEFISSPNYGKGRFFQNVEKIVVHSMAGWMNPSIDRFRNPAYEVSAHYLIGHDGREVQMVDENNTAWHCGVRVPFNFNNQKTIGIETEGGRVGDQVIPLGDDGHRTLARRISTIHKQRGWGEPSSRTVTQHRDMPYCKTECPTGIDIARIIQEAQDEFNGRNVVQVPVVLESMPQTSYTSTAVQPKVFGRFDMNLAPSQLYRAEVRRMQEFLSAKGFISLSSNEYGYYGRKTQAAVDAFQKKNGILASPSYFGLWYEKTRAKANEQLTI